MKTRDIGMILVSESDRLVGTVTDRDIVIRGIAEGRPENRNDGDIMTTHAAYCFEDQDVSEAARLMKGRKIAVSRFLIETNSSASSHWETWPSGPATSSWRGRQHNRFTKEDPWPKSVATLALRCL
jgi:hypothetical protein